MRLVRMRSGLAGVLLAGGLVGGLGGCSLLGPDESPPAPAQQLSLSPQQLVSNATKKSQNASTARFKLSTVISTPEGKIRVYAYGLMDQAAPAMAMNTRVTLPGVPATTVKQRTVGGTVYMSGIPGAAGRWVSVDADRAKQFQQGATSNPADSMAVFEKLGDGVKKVGPATAAGRATTKYSGTVNLTKPATADESPALKQARKDFAEAGLTSIPFTFYIDQQGMLVRMAMSMDLSQAVGGGTRGTMVTAMNYYDWGDPVRIVAPAGAVDLKTQLSSSPRT